MNTMPSAATIAPAGNYGTTRFNALRHGVLSRYTVLPWEDEAEYQSLLAALVAEHAPEGPTEEHLVEELAGIIWRKRRARIAEAAVFRERLRHKATDYNSPDHISGAALLPLTGATEVKASIARAISATAAETARDLRETKRDQGMTQRALNILEAGGAGAYERALTGLRNDTQEYWQDCLSDPPDDGLTYAATAAALKAWIDHHRREWYDQPIVELQHRDAIRDQALGVAYGADALEVPARYEVHLDRKLERSLAMLIRLKELRQPTRA
jgi:broad specificity phosphatase PhoE